MEIYDATFTASYALNEQIARQVFEALPECGLVLAIVDRDGNCWSSDSEAFGKLNLSETLLDDLRAKVDDGAEPAVTQVGDVGVVMAQLATEDTICGYLILAVSRCGSESVQASIDMAEALIGLITLVAKLIERNGLLNDAQMKCYSIYGTAEAPLN